MFTFDGPNKLILIDAGTTTMPAATLYTEWLAWSLLPGNDIYPVAAAKLAGEVLGYGQVQSDYYKIMNGWKVVPYNGDYTLIVSGNLFGDAGSSVFNLATGNILIIMQYTSNSVTPGPLGLSEVEHNHLMSLNTDVISRIGRTSVQSSGLTSVEKRQLDYIYAIATKLDSKGL